MPKTAASSSAHVLFKACSDPTRLRILHMLRGGELCVCDIVKVLNAPQPKVSRHLGHLRKAGLVNARKDGLWIHYSLRRAADPLHKKLLAALDCCAPRDRQRDADTRRLSRVRAKALCCR